MKQTPDTTKKNKDGIRVAKDVLAMLAAKKLKAESGVYFEVAADPDKEPKDLQDFLKKTDKPCRVCALGACFSARILRTDNMPFYDTYSRSEMELALGEVFGQYQLDLIETAFENYGDVAPSGWGDVTDEDAEKAWKLANRYKTDNGRLKAIANNIINNNGWFVP